MCYKAGHLPLQLIITPVQHNDHLTQNTNILFGQSTLNMKESIIGRHTPHGFLYYQQITDISSVVLLSATIKYVQCI